MPHVSVAYSPAPRQVLEWVIEVPDGATVRDAILSSGWTKACPGQEPDDIGIWGRRCMPGHLVHDGDRVEIYRALLVDPKVARRERFTKQGARAAGLFAKRRPGAKPGY